MKVYKYQSSNMKGRLRNRKQQSRKQKKKKRKKKIFPAEI